MSLPRMRGAGQGPFVVAPSRRLRAPPPRWPLSKPSLMADTNDQFDQKPGNKYWVDVQARAVLLES